MNINTDLLQAFLETHKEGSFTKAAKSLGLTQSALSQKIARLEDQLEATLITRDKNNSSLTSAGEKLLLFAKDQIEREQDFLSQFHSMKSQVSGTLRVASFSSVMSSAVIPSLAKLQRKNNEVSIEFTSYDMNHLESILKRNQADIIITDYQPTLANIHSSYVGDEEYVIIESKSFNSQENIYLDHSINDNATESFLTFQDQDLNYKRKFMGDVHGILSGVKLGLGRAVMSKHLVKDKEELKIKKFKKRYFRKVYLSYLKKGYYSPLQKEVVKALEGRMSETLKYR